MTSGDRRPTRLFPLMIPVILLLLAPRPAPAAIQCYDCHGTREPVDYRPVDAPYRNITTGGFQGNHRTHATLAAGFGQCVRCHPGSDQYTQAHRDGRIKLAANINGSRLPARYNNSTSAFPQATAPQLAGCTSVNCHFERPTPAWGGPLLAYPGDCGACHGAPPAGGTGGAAGSHPRHSLAYPGAAGCSLCHPGHTTFGHATSVGRPLQVTPRHPADSQAGSYSGPLDDYLPSQANAFGSCSAVYCHSDGTGVATGTTLYSSPLWGGSLTCSGCHGNPPSYQNGSPKANSHTRTPTACQLCHASTTADGTTITTSANHADKGYNVTPAIPGLFSYTFAPAGGSCSANYCHTDGTTVATGLPSPATVTWGTSLNLTCSGCHGNPPAYASGLPKANSHNTPEHLRYGCNFCHYATTGDGTTITGPASHGDRAYTLNPSVAGLFSYSYQPTGGSCNNVHCHSDLGSRAWGATLPCGGCHDSPPQTPSHLKHYGGSAADAGYGDTRIAADFGATAGAYRFNCGNCHPLDQARHRNGVVEVELHNPQAPAGSLKARHPATAAYAPGGTIFQDSRGYPYTKGGCSNVYCHSYNQWTTPGGSLVTTRLYKSPTWEGTLPADCSGCHGNPPKTYMGSNADGTGDSHYFALSSDYNNFLDLWEQGHGNKVWYSIEPIPCSACHHDTVTQANRWSRQGFTTYSGVPVANFARHVNGTNDVAFDRSAQYRFSYYDMYGVLHTVYKNLTSAGYTPATRSCANVSCHRAETTVQWGTPYNGYNVYNTGDFTHCNRCHADDPMGY